MELTLTGKWTTRQASIKDAESISQLYREVNNYPDQKQHQDDSMWSGEPRSVWTWWMIDNPTGISHSFVADDSGQIIAHNGSIGVYFSAQGNKLLGVFGWGRITLANYRRQGISKTLWEKDIEPRTKEGILFSLGIATNMGETANRAFGMNLLGRSNILIKLLDPHTLVYKRTRSRLLAITLGTVLNSGLTLFSRIKRKTAQRKPGNVFQVEYFDERFDTLWMQVKETVQFSLWKDAEYLNWRYINRPNAEYTILAIEDDHSICGFLVLRLCNKIYHIGHIVDFVCLPGMEDYAAQLIDHGIAYFQRQKVDLVSCAILKNNPYYHLFKEKGFIHRGESGMWTLSKEINLPDQDIKNINNWYLMYGDTSII